MLNIVNKILIECNYKLELETEKSLFMKNIEKMKKDYYFVANLGEYDDIANLKLKVDEAEKEYNDLPLLYADIPKNTTAIFLININEEKYLKKIYNFIYELEENAFGMRRNVLYFTNSELEAIKNSGEIMINKLIFDSIKNQEQFENFKRGLKGKALYSIVSKLFIKLNCLQYPFSTNKEFTYLESQIESRSEQTNTYLRNNHKDLKSELEKLNDKSNYITFYNCFKKSVEEEIEDDLETRVAKKIEFISKAI